ncbi:MAG: hypothetical protein K6E18_09710 [Lachnospiraceae bacterium]|nr:hypothetical protein [Lachnospiraceae bacterium]
MSLQQNENDDRAEQRRKKRRKEQITAIGIAAGAVLVVILVLVLTIGGLVRVFSKGDQKQAEKTEQTQAAKEEQEAVEEVADLAKADDQEAESEESTEEGKEEELSADTDQAETESASDDEGTSDDPEPSEDTDLEEAETEEGADDEDQNTESLWSDEEDDAQLISQIEAEISQMTTEQKVARLFIVSPGQLCGTEIEPKDVGSRFSEMMNNYPVAGILLKKENIGTEEEFSSMLSNLRLMMPQTTILTIEDQGGEESPFVVRGVTENVIASEKEIGESLGNAGAYSAGISIGSQLRTYGIRLNLAPTVDVSETAGSFALRTGFGKDMDTNAELGKNMIRGMKDQGILCAVKSFPGYGDVTEDGSKGQVLSNKSKEQLIAASKPYQEAVKAGADMVMISHIGLPKIRGDQRPASMSKEVITDIVRDEWGYDGVVITDYMDKSCIFTKYTYAESAAGAIEAGADILLSTKNFIKAYNGVLDAVKKGTISEERLNESVKRILKLAYKSTAP